MTHSTCPKSELIIRIAFLPPTRNVHFIFSNTSPEKSLGESGVIHRDSVLLCRLSIERLLRIVLYVSAHRLFCEEKQRELLHDGAFILLCHRREVVRNFVFFRRCFFFVDARSQSWSTYLFTVPSALWVNCVDEGWWVGITVIGPECAILYWNSV